MNKHFDRNGDQSWREFPHSSYGKLDFIEFVDDETVVVGVDLVGKGDANRCIEEVADWPSYWRKRFDDAGRGTRQEDDGPFEKLPIYHLELVLTQGSSKEFWGSLGDEQWVSVELGDPLSGEPVGTVYGGLFSPGIEVSVKGTAILSMSQSGALQGAFSMSGWPTASNADIDKLLNGLSFERLAIYDVGQGLGTALLPRQGECPVLFHDLGAGVYRHAHTRNPNLLICESFAPPVLLSHWDSDHWSGATCYGTNPASFLSRDWIAPFDLSIGFKHIAFANSILSAGGRIHLVPTGFGGLNISLATGSMRLSRGNGKTRNNTGLTLDINLGGAHGRWLLTGDVDYDFIPSAKGSHYSILVVPHHGAKRSSAVNPVPAPDLNAAIQRIIYSFGPGSSWHPVIACIQDHENVGWTCPSYAASSYVATSQPMGLSIATASNVPVTRHGNALCSDITVQPIPISPSCGNKITQFIQS